MAVKTIADINEKYSYEDKASGGKNDSPLVSCGQCGNYNELQYIYDEKLKPLVDKKKITKDDAIDALDKACAGVKNPRKREDFYEHLSESLGVKIA